MLAAVLETLRMLQLKGALGDLGLIKWSPMPDVRSAIRICEMLLLFVGRCMALRPADVY